MAKTGKSATYSSATHGVLAGLALLLPSLTLIPLGGMYLWEHGLLLWWAAAALLLVSAATLALRHLLRKNERVTPRPELTEDPGSDPHYSAQEAKAWQDVLDIAARVDVEQITSTDYFVALGQRTLDTVANRLHPEKEDALWRFTLPEALAIVERVSRRLGGFVAGSIPFGDKLTVAQLLAMYRWRGVFDAAERAYDIWRILRIVNPATAVTNEARERLSRAVYNYGKEHVSRRIAEAFVEEVGRAAIDLYGGRLNVAQKISSGEAPFDDPLAALSSKALVLNLTIAGASRGDRLAVASMLSHLIDSHNLSPATASPSAITLVGAPVAVRADSDDAGALSQELADADIIVFLVAQGALDRDRNALSETKARLRRDGDLVAPVLIATLLNGEASPDASNDWAAALADAIGAHALPPVSLPSLDVAAPAALAPLIAVIADKLPQARRTQVVRTLAQIKRKQSWGSSARQVFKAAGQLTRAVTRRR